MSKGAELAHAYVAVSLSTGGLGKDLTKQLGDAGDRAGGFGGQRAGKSLSAHLGGFLRKSVVGIGLAAGGVLGASLAKGWSRLTNIENATAKLSGLGNSAKTVSAIMDNALKSVKGTAFGLDEAATVAAGAVASGVKPGKDLQRTLGLVADAATIGGTSMGEMGAIFNKVAASGKIQGDVIAQLGDKGIPILQLLGKQIGKTPAEVAKLASKGKIDFATFQKAMEQGLGGAALKSGETTTGAFKNMNAAMGRFGAVLLKGVFPAAKTVFGGITKGFDALSATVGPAVEKVSALLAGMFAKAQSAAKDLPTIWDAVKVNPIVQSSLDRLGKVWQTLKDTATAIWPSIQQIGRSLAAATASVGISTWGLLLATVEALAKAMQATLVPALKWVADFMRNNPAIVGAAVAAFTAYKLATNGIRVATTLWTVAQRALNLALSANPIGIVIVAIGALVAAFMYLWKNCEGFRNFWIGAWDRIKAAAATVVSWFKATVLPVMQPIFDTVKRLVGDVIKVFTGLWQFVSGIFTGNWSKAWEGVKTIFSGFWDGVKTYAKLGVQWFTAIPSMIWNAIAGKASSLTSKAGQIMGWVKDGAATALSTVTGWFQSLTVWIWEGIRRGASYLTSLAGGILGWVGEGIARMWAAIIATGRAIVDNIAQGIRNAVGAVVSAVQWVVAQAFAAAPKVSAQDFISTGGGGIPHFAGGGSMRRGGAAIVGEYEPELFIAPANGSVVNQAQIRAAVGAGDNRGPQQLTGSLYLDSGELLGIVRGVVRQSDAAQARRLVGAR